MRIRRRAFVLAALMAFAACSSVEDRPVMFDIIGGVWDFTAQRTLSSNGAVCSDTGSFVFVPADTDMVGTVEWAGACAGPGGVFPTSGKDSIRGAILVNEISQLTFTRVTITGGLVLCSDTATLSLRWDQLGGRATCTGSTIAWHARWPQTIGSVSVDPDSTRLVAGDVVGLEAIVRSSGGARVFGRQVVWTSNLPSVASVDSTGLVTAVASGTATISASVAGHAGSVTIYVPPATALTRVAAGNARTCGLDAAGNAYCWGLGGQGLTGAMAPAPAGGALAFTALAMGYDFACGLAAGGAAHCFGNNDAGQLGGGGTAPQPLPVAVTGGLTFTAITAGRAHACGLTAAGAAHCWGSNADGQLGVSGVSGSPQPVAVQGGYTFSQIAAGAHHTCGVVSGGDVRCWGANAAGQLGDGTTAGSAVPVLVQGAMVFASVAAGFAHSCGVSGITAWCWGDNAGGQLGDGTLTQRSAPVQVGGGIAWASLTLGYNHSCGLSTAGGARCWGVNAFGQLGITGGNRTSPAAVTGGLTFTALSAGVYTYSDEAHNPITSGHTCGISGGKAWCWGDNLVGQLGVGASRAERYAPAIVAGQP